MSRFAIKSDKIVLPGGIDGFGYVVVEDGKFGQVQVQEPDDMPVVDRMGCWVAPGLVDTHIHGYVGHDVMDLDPDGIRAICKALAREGTTSWLATTLTASPETTKAACAAVAQSVADRRPNSLGARVQGIFLEGPFFTDEHKGAQNPAYLCDPSIELLRQWQDAADGMIRKSALAPEREGTADYIRGAREMGVVCAIGHTSASYAAAAQAVLAGATVFVHTYNGMSPFSHRAPGVLGCAFTSQGTFSELICDGQHVDPVAVDVVVRTKGWEHVALVSDCLSCGGLPEGDYFIGELPIRMEGGLARLREGGNIAGSTITMAKAVKNVVDWGLVTAEQAIRMASEIPARSCGIDGECGLILPGRDADLTVLDGELNLVETYVGGQRVSRR